jgi:lipopolysaccharide/colanic/teichoic acid biosynthesis glycosyltransferase
MKRAIDVIVSSTGLLLLSPIIIIFMFILRFSGEGEIFFLQERMGYGNKTFKITKFATMLKSAANMKQGDFTVENDPRVLPIGKFLRKSKLNEILQLWDVLRGQMSLVGPRPQILRIHNLYPKNYGAVLDNIRPGITGIGSLVFRDEERIITNAKNRDYCYSSQIVPYKADLEIWYSKNRSTFLDLILIYLTIWYIFFPKSSLIWAFLPQDIRKDVYSFDGSMNIEGF